jgi:hypothetical protein
MTLGRRRGRRFLKPQNWEEHLEKSGRSGTDVFLPEWMIDYSNIQPFAFGTPCSVAIAISSFFAAT